MKIRNWSRGVALALVLAAAFQAAPALAGRPDAWVTTKVKMSLITSPDVGAGPVHVDTYDGRVTLHGQVNTAAERSEAERLAARVDGVRSVRNLLQVVPESRRKAVDIADDQIADRVQAALKAQPALNNSSIGEKSVHKGVVLLSGKAETLSDHLLALEVASSVPGVRHVASEIESPDEFGDRELWYDDAPAPATGNHAMSDAWITTRTKFTYMTDPDVPAGDINVDTNDGGVTLFGTVPSAAVKVKAERLAQEISGVKSVKNELRVVASKDKKRVMAGDHDLQVAIEKRLTDAGMTGADIHVEVKAAVARLTGSVQRATDRYTAVLLARSTDGVVAVQNDLKIVPPSASKQ